MKFNESISDLLKQNLIKKSRVDYKAIVEFINRAGKDLETAERNLGIDDDCAYTYAYNAMLHSGIALMNSFGYRPEIKNKHLTVIRFAGTILEENLDYLLKMYNNMRKKRHRFIYEPFTPCTKKEAQDAIKSAKEFVKEVSRFIKDNNPEEKLYF
ncbi:HEPN domain-containing protein [candidate division WOR-3 bacterium]|nr:HEPN domain-containing protein [candidate division WOR-3 bacterium]